MSRIEQLEWSDSLLTGDSEIDNEHKAFYLKAKRVLVACQLDRGDAEVMKTLGFMRDYARLHLANEERRMDEAGYPYAQTDKAAHQGLVERLDELERELDEGGDLKTLAEKLATEAVVWFTRHIKGVDRLLIDFLREHPGAKSS